MGNRALVSSGRIQVTQEKNDSAWTRYRRHHECVQKNHGVMFFTEVPGDEIWQKPYVKKIKVMDGIKLTPGKRRKEAEHKEPLTADASTVSDTRILLRMQRIEEGAADQICGPDHGRWGDKEPPCDASNGETNQLGGHHHHPLV